MSFNSSSPSPGGRSVLTRARVRTLLAASRRLLASAMVRFSFDGAGSRTGLPGTGSGDQGMLVLDSPWPGPPNPAASGTPDGLPMGVPRDMSQRQAWEVKDIGTR